MKKIIFLTALSTFIFSCNETQNISFEYEKAPQNTGFKMEAYWVWCGSAIRVDSVYHLFASRWPKTSQFPEGYRTNSEIVHATSPTAYGPYEFKEVVIGERDSSFWDSNMAHNPTIHKIGDEYVLFYIGSDFTTLQETRGQLLRRVGYARSKSIYGPWIRSEKPLIETESNNPAVLADDKRIMLMYRNRDLRVFLAEAPSYEGPYTIKNDNVWPECKLEDFYMFRSGGKYHMICEDNVGGVSGHVRWGIHLYSDDGINDWNEYTPLIAYDHDIVFDDNTILTCTRRERPQLITENDKITYLITSVYDGKNSWSQPVKLKKTVQID